MIEVDFVVPVDELEWISPMVILDKKKRGIQICVVIRNLNDACVHDPFPNPFTDDVLQNVGWCGAYSFIYGFFRLSLGQNSRGILT